MRETRSSTGSSFGELIERDVINFTLTERTQLLEEFQTERRLPQLVSILCLSQVLKVSKTFNHCFTYQDGFARELSSKPNRRLYSLDLREGNETKRYFLKVVWDLVRGWSEAMIPLALNDETSNYYCKDASKGKLMPVSHGLCVDTFGETESVGYFILTPSSGTPIPDFIKSIQPLNWPIVKYCKGLLDMFHGLSVTSPVNNDRVQFAWGDSNDQNVFVDVTNFTLVMADFDRSMITYKAEPTSHMRCIRSITEDYNSKDGVRDVRTIAKAVSLLLKTDTSYKTEGLGFHHKELGRKLDKLECTAPIALRVIKTFALSLPTELVAELDINQYPSSI